ncbi:MAG: sugar ABC transporter ATP-binding protein [Planctomycetota bacterium]|jgi:ABC-type sugar transport system ATPase subunit|nr:sugar ABC transporter ATP-binding protein [Planctomycetota bacterium]
MAAEKMAMRGISKSFGNVKALSGIDFSLGRGEVHTLMGENGAGKSTLMKILVGLCRADAGEIRVDGEPIRLSAPREALDHGIAMIHQELYPVLDMTVADNIFLGREIRRPGFGRLNLVDVRAENAKAALLLAEMGLDAAPTARMRDLSVAETQLVEIIKALSQGAGIIVMDEPTSAITERETERLFFHIGRLKKAGVSIIYISHKMNEIFRISDRVTVLRDGCLVDSRPAAELDPESLVRLMVGREIEDVYPGRGRIAPGEPLLTVRGLSDGRKFHDVSFTLRRGEILGVAGLMGAGRTEMAECLFGLRPKSAGEVAVRGNVRDIRSPRDAIACGMALISDDRKQKGLNLAGTVGENIGLLGLRSFCRRGVISRKLEQAAVDSHMSRLGVRAESSGTPVAALSGGNQQKAVLAKWLLAEPEIMIFDEPTRGIDVGAKHEIYLLMNELAARGKAILMISSEMNEIIGMSDRVIVLADGELAGELGRDGLTQEAIMALASHL